LLAIITILSINRGISTINKSEFLIWSSANWSEKQS